MKSKGFSELEKDAIGEILNISLGASATAASTMLNARVDITTPVVSVVSKEAFEFTNLEPAVAVEITYVSGLEGNNIMLLKRWDVKIIVEMLMGMEIPDEEFELDEMNISAICEVMNQMMGASATALSEFLNKSVNISPPTSFELKDEVAFKEKYFGEGDGNMVVIGFTLKIGDQLESEFINVMPPALAKSLVSGFFPDGEDLMEAEETSVSEPEPDTGSQMMSQEEIERMIAASSQTAPEPEPDTGSRMMSQEEIEKMLAGNQSTPEPEPEPDTGSRMMSQEEIEKMLAGNTQPAQAQAPQVQTPQMQTPQVPMPQVMMDAGSIQSQIAVQQQMLQTMQQMQQMLQAQKSEPKVEVKAEPKMLKAHPRVQPNLTQEDVLGEGQEENMELIMGVPLEVSVEIGRTRKLVKDILGFAKGSLVVLDKVAGEQVDLYVNGRCIAKGDVVVVEDNFGIRITEIIKANNAAE